MELFIEGGKRLSGEITVRSAKNSILPVIACCVLTEETVVIRNCPPMSDVLTMLEIIRNIGGEAEFEDGNIVINCRYARPDKIDERLTHLIRSSVFILGPILSRFRKACVSYPGGCEIGARPIDLHIEGLSALGVKTSAENNLIDCDGSALSGAEIRLRLPSVGATENIMMAAVLAPGTTVIHNAAREPEICDLARFINYIGGRVYGAGSSAIIVEGVKKLGGGEFLPISDRIVSGTYLAACAATGGKICLKGVRFEHIYSVIDRLQAAGCRFGYKKNSITISSSGGLKAIPYTATMPYPGFPTDMQPQLTAMLSLADGISVVRENLFESRFNYITQLKKLGADITVRDNRAVINGVRYLKGGSVEAQDLRGGAALVIAGLAAEGETVVRGVHHIDRGYYRIEEDLRAFGGSITRRG